MRPNLALVRDEEKTKTRTRDERVTEGKRLAVEESGNQWAQGDLALEEAPMGENGVNNGSKKILVQFAEDTGLSYRALEEYRRVSCSWPPTTRVVGVSWSVHRDLIVATKGDVKSLKALVKAKKGEPVTVADVANLPAVIESKLALKETKTTTKAVKLAAFKLGWASVADVWSNPKYQAERFQQLGELIKHVAEVPANQRAGLHDIFADLIDKLNEVLEAFEEEDNILTIEGEEGDDN